MINGCYKWPGKEQHQFAKVELVKFSPGYTSKCNSKFTFKMSTKKYVK